MLEWFQGLAGPEFGTAVLWTFAALVLLVLVLVVIKLIRSLTFGTFVAGGRNRKARLAVMDATAVDSHRRLVLVRRDDTEHLLLIGGPTDVVVERDIRVGQPRRAALAASESQEPPARLRQPMPSAPRHPEPMPPRPRQPEPAAAQRAERPTEGAPRRVSANPEAAPIRHLDRPPEPIRARHAERAPTERVQADQQSAHTRQPPRTVPQQVAMRDVAGPAAVASARPPRETAPIPPQAGAPALQPSPQPNGGSHVTAPRAPALRSPADSLDDALLQELEVTFEQEAATPSAKTPELTLDEEMTKLLGELSYHKRS